jgi:hypothetical protein
METDNEEGTAHPLDRNMSSERDQILFELEQRLAQVGTRLSAEEHLLS